MTVKLLAETAALGTKKGATYKCRLIAAGQGSSGFYSEAMLAEYGPAAFPVGTHSYLNHKSYDDEWSQPERRVQDIAGVITQTPVYENDGLYASIKFTEAGLKLVEELKDDIGLSIYANGVAEDYDGGYNITKLVPSPLNSVDIVTRAGAGGKIMELVESFRATSAEVKKNTERIKMDEKDIKALAEALAAAIKPEFAALTEALKPTPADDTNTEDAVDVAAVAEAMVAADLPESGRKRVYEAMKAEGAEITKVIEAEKAYVAEIVKESAATNTEAGVLRESGNSEPQSAIKVQGW